MLFGGSGRWAAWPCGIIGKLDVIELGPLSRALVPSSPFSDVQFTVLSRGLTKNRVRVSEQPYLERSVSSVITLSFLLNVISLMAHLAYFDVNSESREEQVARLSSQPS